MTHGLKEGRVSRPFAVLPIDFAERVDIVVPVFNALEDVVKCLQSIKMRKDGLIVRTIVVNDGSDSETTTWLKSFCDGDETFYLIEHNGNKGYTKAVNSGLRASTAPYVVALNSDTIVTRGWIKGLVRCIKSDPKIGIVGPLSNAASGKVFLICMIFQEPLQLMCCQTEGCRMIWLRLLPLHHLVLILSCRLSMGSAS